MDRAIEITQQITTVSRLLDRVGDLILSEFRISMGTFEIMALIQAGNDTTSDLARQIGSTPSNITHMTRTLEERGYIVRSVDGKDKRVWRFIISKEGGALLATVQSFYSEAVSLLFSQFSNQQRNDVSNFLKATQEHLEMLVGNGIEVKEMMMAMRSRTNQEG